eukprot:4840173-Pyramimonas_sp.AAC.1
MASFPITAGSFNALQASSTDRLTDIADPRGTQLRRREVLGRVLVEAGWSAGELTNGHCGCSVLRGRKVKLEHLIRTECTPSLIGGRGLLCRARSGMFDITVIALYFPPSRSTLMNW